MGGRAIGVLSPPFESPCPHAGAGEGTHTVSKACRCGKNATAMVLSAAARAFLGPYKSVSGLAPGTEF